MIFFAKVVYLEETTVPYKGACSTTFLIYLLWKRWFLKRHKTVSVFQQKSVGCGTVGLFSINYFRKKLHNKSLSYTRRDLRAVLAAPGGAGVAVGARSHGGSRVWGTGSAVALWSLWHSAALNLVSIMHNGARCGIKPYDINLNHGIDNRFRYGVCDRYVYYDTVQAEGCRRGRKLARRAEFIYS